MKKVRIIFKKTGKLRYISHLDLNRIMLRFVRITALPLLYSEGFHPRPHLSVAAPLSLGFEGEYEILDITLAEQVSDKEIFERFCDVFPKGLEVVSVAPPVLKPREIEYSRYEIEGDFDFDAESLVKSGELFVIKKTKRGNETTVDIKSRVKQITQTDNKLDAVLCCSSESNLNPNQLISAFEQKLAKPVMVTRVVRRAIYTKDMSLFK